MTQIKLTFGYALAPGSFIESSSLHCALTSELPEILQPLDFLELHKYDRLFRQFAHAFNLRYTREQNRVFFYSHNFGQADATTQARRAPIDNRQQQATNN
jgi:hypothetical protein